MPKGSSVASSARPLRGEIWEFDLRPRKGREQTGVYPCLVVSTDALNRSNFGTVIVCPITTTHRPSFQFRPGLLPSDLRIADSSWEAKPNWVETDQIVTIDVHERALRHLATIINRDKLEEIDRWLRTMLSL
ncbi:MAG TPA: type II toxin-antitoxin system PemK/MazF family toxin [Longimicrobium sp.]|nr:type II toxin-antitoxin system PemK/MazF family toxin [Longimicrobium sp.]